MRQVGRLFFFLFFCLAQHSALARVPAPSIPAPDIPKPWEIKPEAEPSVDVPPLVAPELIARIRSSPYVISVWQHGHPWKSTCTFEIEVHGYRERVSHGLKGPYSDLCPTFGDQYLRASDGLERGSRRIVYVGAMGGDGDHTGPLVRLLSYTNGAIQLLGTTELFNARIVRHDDVIKAVKGEKLFSLCFMCGGRDLSHDGVVVPVVVTFDEDQMHVQADLDREGREAVITEFDLSAERYLETAAQDRSAVRELRAELLRFLETTSSD